MLLTHTSGLPVGAKVDRPARQRGPLERRARHTAGRRRRARARRSAIPASGSWSPARSSRRSPASGSTRRSRPTSPTRSACATPASTRNTLAVRPPRRPPAGRHRRPIIAGPAPGRRPRRRRQPPRRHRRPRRHLRHRRRPRGHRPAAPRRGHLPGQADPRRGDRAPDAHQRQPRASPPSTPSAPTAPPTTASASPSTRAGSWASSPRPGPSATPGSPAPRSWSTPDRKLVLVLLTNRAHPNWSWANPDPVRGRRRRPARHEGQLTGKVWTIAPHPDTILALVVQILRPSRWRIDAHVSPEPALRGGRSRPRGRPVRRRRSTRRRSRRHTDVPSSDLRARQRGSAAQFRDPGQAAGQQRLSDRHHRGPRVRLPEHRDDPAPGVRGARRTDLPPAGGHRRGPGRPARALAGHLRLAGLPQQLAGACRPGRALRQPGRAHRDLPAGRCAHARDLG